MEHDVHVWTDEGHELQASFAVETRDGHPTVVLRSASGTNKTKGAPARNPHYAEALEVLLTRIGKLGAEIWDIQVDSLKTTALPVEERRLSLRLPLKPGHGDDIRELRKEITRAETKVGRSQGATGYGNGRKQIRLWLKGEDLGRDPSHLQRSLSGELAVSEMARELDEVARTEPTFDPYDDTDARRHVLRTIIARRGQQSFRDALIDAYRGRCFLSGSPCVVVLEAAHVLPHKGEHSNHVANGLLLRADIHTLFDLGLIAICAREDGPWRVLRHHSLIGSSYETELRIGDLPLFCTTIQHRNAFTRALQVHQNKSGLK